MYFSPRELTALLTGLREQFDRVQILMDCYTERGAKASKYKNPIHDVGVTEVYGYDDPLKLAEAAGLTFRKEYSMTPERMILALEGIEQKIFRTLFGGRIAGSIYRMYELEH